MERATETVRYEIRAMILPDRKRPQLCIWDRNKDEYIKVGAFDSEESARLFFDYIGEACGESAVTEAAESTGIDESVETALDEIREG